MRRARMVRLSSFFCCQHSCGIQGADEDLPFATPRHGGGAANLPRRNRLPARPVSTSARRMAMPKPLIARCLADLAGAGHGFFTRQGGVSQGGYASLNCGLGSKDDPAAVRENRARIAAALGANRLI